MCRPTIESTVTALPIYSSPSSTSTTSRTSSSSSTSTSPAPTSPFVTPTPSPSSGGGSNAGAIAGGVVGGLAAIGLILGAVLLFLARKRRARNASAPNTGVPPHNGQVQYQGPNMSNPNTLSMSSQQMYNPQHQPLGSTSPPHHLSNPQMQTSPLLHGDYMHPQHSGQMPQPQGQTYLTSDGTGYTGQSRGSTDVTGSTVGYRGSDVPTGADGFKPATSGVVESGGSEVPKKIEPQNPNRHEMA
ncbi:MAG: hypothetical protein M1814_006057 [Vezdaea aestivalis]|nr:MAG: hypothetical protein M1814_006057 [Vezdaea aestivalis]